jgi:subtilisin family serine protease
LWDAGFTGRGVLVGHLDTGVDGSHPALAGALAAFAEFDSLGKLLKNAAKPRDSGNHGTHTAGTIVGRPVGKTHFGVAPEARLASAMVIEGGNVVARILAGMDWAIGKGVRILNMSLGLRGFTPAFLTLSSLLRGRGILPVFAVGNEGPGTSRSPGNYVEALSVGACDEDDGVADFSGSQRFARGNDPLVPDLVGPGVNVLSCVPNKQYAAMSGSSMATPHIAGLAALLLQAVPTATPDQLEHAIFGSCELPPGMHPARANRGIPNGPRALSILTGAPLAQKAPTRSRTATKRKRARKK